MPSYCACLQMIRLPDTGQLLWRALAKGGRSASIFRRTKRSMPVYGSVPTSREGIYQARRKDSDRDDDRGRASDGGRDRQRLEPAIDSTLPSCKCQHRVWKPSLLGCEPWGRDPGGCNTSRHDSRRPVQRTPTAEPRCRRSQTHSRQWGRGSSPRTLSCTVLGPRTRYPAHQ